MTARHSHLLIDQNEALHLAVKVMTMERSEGTYQSFFLHMQMKMDFPIPTLLSNWFWTLCQAIIFTRIFTRYCQLDVHGNSTLT